MVEKCQISFIVHRYRRQLAFIKIPTTIQTTSLEFHERDVVYAEVSICDKRATTYAEAKRVTVSQFFQQRLNQLINDKGSSICEYFYSTLCT